MIFVGSSVLMASLIFNFFMETNSIQNDVWAVEGTLNMVKWLRDLVNKDSF